MQYFSCRILFVVSFLSIVFCECFFFARSASKQSAGILSGTNMMNAHSAGA